MSNTLTYQEAFFELQKIVEEIEKGETEIDELSKKINRASKLIEICHTKLTATEKEVELLLNKLNDSSSQNIN